MIHGGGAKRRGGTRYIASTKLSGSKKARPSRSCSAGTSRTCWSSATCTCACGSQPAAALDQRAGHELHRGHAPRHRLRPGRGHDVPGAPHGADSAPAEVQPDRVRPVGRAVHHDAVRRAGPRAGSGAHAVGRHGGAGRTATAAAGVPAQRRGPAAISGSAWPWSLGIIVGHGADRGHLDRVRGRGAGVRRVELGLVAAGHREAVGEATSGFEHRPDRCAVARGGHHAVGQDGVDHGHRLGRRVRRRRRGKTLYADSGVAAITGFPAPIRRSAPPRARTSYPTSFTRAAGTASPTAWRAEDVGGSSCASTAGCARSPRSLRPAWVKRRS